jgi:glycerophosphoryl diester phosphodiesterase
VATYLGSDTPLAEIKLSLRNEGRNHEFLGMTGPGMRPLIDAHGGECGIPDLPACERYRRAIALGVDFVEVDIRRSTDGEFFTYHDDRTPSGLEVRALSYNMLERDLGPELVKVGDVIDMADGKVGLHVDVKEEGYESEIVRFIQQCCKQSEVVFTSGDAPIRRIKELFPNVRTGLSLGDELQGAPPWRYLQMRWGAAYPRLRLQRCGADFAAVDQRPARLRVLDYCASVRMPAWVWTVNREAEIKSFLRDPRVTVLITDRPDIALRFRAA